MVCVCVCVCCCVCGCCCFVVAVVLLLLFVCVGGGGGGGGVRACVCVCWSVVVCVCGGGGGGGGCTPSMKKQLVRKESYRHISIYCKTVPLFRSSRLQVCQFYLPLFWTRSDDGNPAQIELVTTPFSNVSDSA